MDLQTKIAGQVHSLPTLPTIFSKLSDVMSNPRATTSDVAKIISTDQAASTKVLKVVNSPFYGFSGKIDTISRAIMLLGFDEVRNIVFAISVINMFSRSKLIMHFRPVEFWAHSIGTGIAARLIAKSMGISKLENFFLGGILHDVGKLVLFEYAPVEYEEVLKMVMQNKITIIEAEREILKTDHTRIGTIIADKWKLPSSLKSVIAYHHIGVVGEKPDILVAAIHLADIVARIMEFGFAGDEYVQKPEPAVWASLKLTEGFLERQCENLVNSFDSTVSMILND